MTYGLCRADKILLHDAGGVVAAGVAPQLNAVDSEPALKYVRTCLGYTAYGKLREYRDDLIASGRYRPSAVVNSGNIEYIEMRVSTLAVSAGTGAFLDEENFEKLRFPAHTVPANADFGVRVQGDSMEPVYHDGQIAWVQSCTSLRPGEVGVFVCDGEGFLKVYEERAPDAEELEEFVDSGGVLHLQPVLVSYNESYAPRIIAPSSSFLIAGRVLN